MTHPCDRRHKGLNPNLFFFLNCSQILNILESSCLYVCRFGLRALPELTSNTFRRLRSISSFMILTNLKTVGWDPPCMWFRALCQPSMLLLVRGSFFKNFCIDSTFHGYIYGFSFGHLSYGQ